MSSSVQHSISQQPLLPPRMPPGWPPSRLLPGLPSISGRRAPQAGRPPVHYPEALLHPPACRSRSAPACPPPRRTSRLRLPPSSLERRQSCPRLVLPSGGRARFVLPSGGCAHRAPSLSWPCSHRPPSLPLPKFGEGHLRPRSGERALRWQRHEEAWLPRRPQPLLRRLPRRWGTHGMLLCSAFCVKNL